MQNFKKYRLKLSAELDGSQQCNLERVSPHLELVSWMYLHQS